CLSLVGMEGTSAVDHCVNATRWRKGRDIAVSSRGCAANNDSFWRGTKSHGRVLGLAHGRLVNQNYLFAGVMRLLRSNGDWHIRPMKSSGICGIHVGKSRERSLGLHEMRT